MESLIALDLVHQARAAGLEVHAQGSQLVVRGPKAAEPLARELLGHKWEVLALLTADDPEVAWRAAAMWPQVPPNGCRGEKIGHYSACTLVDVM